MIRHARISDANDGQLLGRSLAVVAGQQGKGIGRKIVESCLKKATDLGINRVFVLIVSSFQIVMSLHWQ